MKDGHGKVGAQIIDCGAAAWTLQDFLYRHRKARQAEIDHGPVEPIFGPTEFRDPEEANERMFELYSSILDLLIGFSEMDEMARRHAYWLVQHFRRGPGDEHNGKELLTSLRLFLGCICEVDPLGLMRGLMGLRPYRLLKEGDVLPLAVEEQFDFCLENLRVVVPRQQILIEDGVIIIRGKTSPRDVAWIPLSVIVGCLVGIRRALYGDGGVLSVQLQELSNCTFQLEAEKVLGVPVTLGTDTRIYLSNS